MGQRTPVRVVAEDLNQHQAAKQALATCWPLFFLRHFALFRAHQMAPFCRALMVAQSVVQFTISTEKTQPIDFNRF
jgi:hypothetical protein